MGSSLLTGRSQEGPRMASAARARAPLAAGGGPQPQRARGWQSHRSSRRGSTREVPGTAPHGDRHPFGRLAGWRRWCSLKVTILGSWNMSPLASGGSEVRLAPLGPALPLGAQRSHVCLLHCPEQASPSPAGRRRRLPEPDDAGLPLLRRTLDSPGQGQELKGRTAHPSTHCPLSSGPQGLPCDHGSPG